MYLLPPRNMHVSLSFWRYSFPSIDSVGVVSGGGGGESGVKGGVEGVTGRLSEEDVVASG